MLTAFNSTPSKHSKVQSVPAAGIGLALAAMSFVVTCMQRLSQARV